MKISPLQSAQSPLRSKSFGRASRAAGFSAQLQSKLSPEDPSSSFLKTIGAGAVRGLSPLENVRGIKAPPEPMLPLQPVAPPVRALEAGDMVPGVKSVSKTEEEKVEQLARKWVSQTFYGQMLKQMRNSPFKSDLLQGGRGGQAFNMLFDQHLADKMTRATDDKLVRAITRKMLKAAGDRQSPAPSADRVNSVDTVM